MNIKCNYLKEQVFYICIYFYPKGAFSRHLYIFYVFYVKVKYMNGVKYSISRNWQKK